MSRMWCWTENVNSALSNILAIPSLHILIHRMPQQIVQVLPQSITLNHQIIQPIVDHRWSFRIQRCRHKFRRMWLMHRTWVSYERHRPFPVAVVRWRVKMMDWKSLSKSNRTVGWHSYRKSPTQQRDGDPGKLGCCDGAVVRCCNFMWFVNTAHHWAWLCVCLRKDFILQTVGCRLMNVNQWFLCLANLNVCFVLYHFLKFMSMNRIY